MPGFFAVEGRGVVVAAPRIGDDAVAGLGEHRLLVTPDQRAAGRRMQQHDRHARPAGVPVPETGVGNLRHAVLGRGLRGEWGWVSSDWLRFGCVLSR